MTFDPFDPQPEYQTHVRILDVEASDDAAEETYRLALESAQRWLNNYRLSPAMRLRALRSVVQSALDA